MKEMPIRRSIISFKTLVIGFIALAIVMAATTLLKTLNKEQADEVNKQKNS